MRISDWSSDVCSSDLHHCDVALEVQQGVIAQIVRRAQRVRPFEQTRAAHRQRVRREQFVGDVAGVVAIAEADRDVAAIEQVAALIVHPGRRGVEAVCRLDHDIRSEEHTSELQSLMRISYAVFCLKKKKIHTRKTTKITTKVRTQRRT